MKIARALASVCLGIASPAMSQTMSRYDIPAQDLGSALRMFAQVSGRQLAFAPETVRGKMSHPISGRFTVEAALVRLLGVDGPIFQKAASGIFIITARPPERSSDPILPPQDIIVTARKREERALDVPVALTAVDGRTIEKRGTRSVGDTLREAPGLGVYETAAGFSKIVIRGISTSLGGNENGYYLDDLPFTGVTVPIAPDVRAWDLDRVEILRGPQGTLFGEGSMGGTVRILSHGADLDRWEAKGDGYASSTLGGGINRGIKGAFNAPVVPGALAIRVAGTAEALPGWIDNPDTGARRVNDQTVTTFRTKVRFDPVDRLSITGSYWWQSSTILGGGNVATDSGLQSRSIVNDIGNFYRLFGVSARHELGGAQAYYSFSRNRLAVSQAGTILAERFIGDIGINVVAHEARVTSSNNGRLKWTAGIYARDATRNDTLVFATYSIDNRRSDRSAARALFGELTYSLSKIPVDVTAGLRGYREQLTGFEIDGVVRADKPARTSTSWNPRFSVAWHPALDATIYASAAKGFRAGQLQSGYSAALARAEGITLPDTLGQDTIWTYEIGAKANLLDRRLVVEAALYHSDWNDVAVRAPIGTTGFNGLINSRGTRTNGGEIGIVATPAAGFGVAANLSYVDAVYADSVPGTGIVSGAPVDDVARLTTNIGIDYHRQVARDTTVFGRVNWTHSSPRYFVAFPGFLPGDPIDQVDARIGVDAGALTIALFVDNALNDGGAVSARTVQPVRGINDIVANRLRPRTFGIQLSTGFSGSARQ